MKKVTFIIGNQGTGKTTKAKEIVGNRKAIWIDSLSMDLATQGLTATTEVIVIEEFLNTDIDLLKEYMSMTTIVFRLPFTYAEIVMNIPDIIIISQDESLLPLMERRSIEIINMKEEKY